MLKRSTDISLCYRSNVFYSLVQGKRTIVETEQESECRKFEPRYDQQVYPCARHLF